jgi:hypothetical protein
MDYKQISNTTTFEMQHDNKCSHDLMKDVHKMSKKLLFELKVKTY